MFECTSHILGGSKPSRSGGGVTAIAALFGNAFLSILLNLACKSRCDDNTQDDEDAGDEAVSKGKLASIMYVHILSCHSIS